MREILSQIEQAYKKNNHKLSKYLLNSIKSDELKREAFLNIIDYYEQEKGLFPVGYSLLFIEWLLKKQDTDLAKHYISKCNRLEVTNKRISELIFEYIIRPNESQYRDRLNSNIELLKKNKILFTDLEFNFENIKKDILIVANYQDKYFVSEGKSILFLVDTINLNEIQRLLDKGYLIYLIHDDLKKFHYMLLFEDLSQLNKYIQKKKIIFCGGRDTRNLDPFFSNMMISHPDYYIDLSTHKDYPNIIKQIIEAKKTKLISYIKKLKEYYKNKNYQYYKDLFSKYSSNIKILLITSCHTDLNQHICKSWYNAFIELGYTARLLIENEPYESMTISYIVEQMYRFKPDIVFHINYTVNTLFREEEIRRSLLWIMRYRDQTDISFADRGYEYGNMFILPAVEKTWADDLKMAGIPSNRILYIPDGVDLNIFTKKEMSKEKYACDIVSVNNSGGNETYRFRYVLNSFNNNDIRQIIHELYADLNELAFHEDFIFADTSFEKLLNEKLYQRGFQINQDAKKRITRLCCYIMTAFYRTKVIEWIVDSKITNNIKLWGTGWSNLEKFKNFHMGVAKYGERLSEIYRNSKISISDQPSFSLHERNFEILASGGFPLVKHIEPENNEKIDNITNYFKENEEIVLFYNKDDLLNKIQFYLDHPEERERIAENGRSVVIEKFSNIAVVKKTMGFIKRYYAT